MTSGGTVEERRVEAAEQRHRPFGEAGVFGDEAFVGDEFEPRLGGEGFGAGADQRAALVLKSTMTWQARSFST